MKRFHSYFICFVVQIKENNKINHSTSIFHHIFGYILVIFFGKFLFITGPNIQIYTQLYNFSLGDFYANWYGLKPYLAWPLEVQLIWSVLRLWLNNGLTSFIGYQSHEGFWNSVPKHFVVLCRFFLFYFFIFMNQVWPEYI